MNRSYTELKCGCLISCDSGGGLIPCYYDQINPDCKAKEYMDEHKQCEVCGECLICYIHDDCKKQKEQKFKEAFQTILLLIGNVNHATKTGANDAFLRGQLLNDIRDIINKILYNK